MAGLFEKHLELYKFLICEQQTKHDSFKVLETLFTLYCAAACSSHIINKFRNCSFSSHCIVVFLPVPALRLQVRWNRGGNPDKIQTRSQPRIQRFHQVLPLCLGPVYSEFGLDLRPVSPQTSVSDCLQMTNSVNLLNNCNIARD